MSDEALEVTAVDTAPVADATAASVADDIQPVESTTDAAKSFSQEELDAIVGKRLAREQRKWEREQAQRLADLEVRRAPTINPPDVNDFDDAQAYAEALAERKAQELLAKRDMAKQQAALLDVYHEKEEDARGRYDDFEQVAYNPNLPVTDVMAQTIQASDNGPDVIYWLGSNPKEAGRISALPPILQAREIGKIEARLAASPPVKKTSTAPAPIAPIANSRSSGKPAFDTTDPRSVKSMSTSEWIEADRMRQIKKQEAQRNR